MEESRQSPVTRLAAEVLTYASPPFVLQDDLNRLAAVQRAAAPEAVILYCARILEALAGDALRRVGQVPSTNVFSNLQLLEHLNRIGSVARYGAHAIRRLGNVVRHVRQRVGPEEAALATVLAEGCLDWFFCRFSHGYRLPALTRDEGPLGLAAADEFRALMKSLEQLEAAGASAQTGLRQADVEGDPAFFMTPVLPAILAESRLSRKEHAEAFGVLSAGLSRFPDDLRLRQLMGLYWSRAEDPDRALQWLEPLYAGADADDETVGMTAGVYKRRWQADRAKREDLERLHRAYQDAWKRSGKRNAYLGINSATTALWLGRAEVARRLAKEVEDLLRRRVAALPADLSDPRLALAFWDQVTLAEAQLVQGDWAAAQQTYGDAFARHADRRGDIEVSRKQRSEILRALGLPDPIM